LDAKSGWHSRRICIRLNNFANKCPTFFVNYYRKIFKLKYIVIFKKLFSLYLV
jgi:hypothetical protein